MTKPSDFHTNDTALVLVDHQVGTITWAGELTPDQREQLKIWVTFIAKFAKAAGMPIVLTTMQGVHDRHDFATITISTSSDASGDGPRRPAISGVWLGPDDRDS